MIDTNTLANDARGRWAGILEAHGFDPKCLRNVHGPCPLGCGGQRSWRFDDQLNGRWICTHCGSGDGFDALRKKHGWDFPKVKAEVAAMVGAVPVTFEQRPERSQESKAKACRELLEGASCVEEGSPAWLWLRYRCGYPVAIYGDLRAHPGIRHTASGDIHPAMLAIMRYADGHGASVHRTYLTPDGRKADVDPVRMMMPGSPLNGSAVRLGPIAERIGIAEGIETALCASKMFKIPVWAATNAGLLSTWEPPKGVGAVVICGDNDANFTGQNAAYALAKRLRTVGIDVEVRIPHEVGTDWADVFKGEGWGDLT